MSSLSTQHKVCDGRQKNRLPLSAGGSTDTIISGTHSVDTSVPNLTIFSLLLFDKWLLTDKNGLLFSFKIMIKMALRIATTCCFIDFSVIQAQSEIVVQVCGLSTGEMKQWISLSEARHSKFQASQG